MGRTTEDITLIPIADEPGGSVQCVLEEFKRLSVEAAHASRPEDKELVLSIIEGHHPGGLRSFNAYVRNVLNNNASRSKLRTSRLHTIRTSLTRLTSRHSLDKQQRWTERIRVSV